MTNNNQPNVGEVLCKLLKECQGCAGGDCLNCGGGTTGIPGALTKLTEIIEKVINTTGRLGYTGVEWVNKQNLLEDLTKAGFPLNKGGENGK